MAQAEQFTNRLVATDFVDTTSLETCGTGCALLPTAHPRAFRAETVTNRKQ